jgi:hypothetical protein
MNQAICEQRPEPDFDPEELGFTGDAERAFALAILEDVLGMRWNLKCPDCQGYDPESYLAHDAVWAEAGLEPDGGWVHLSCLSRRLGRPLIQADFPGSSSSTQAPTVGTCARCASGWRAGNLQLGRVVEGTGRRRVMFHKKTKITEKDGYWWVECAGCEGGWQVPKYAKESVA